MEFSFWNCSGFSYRFVCWELGTICFEGKAAFSYFSFFLIFFSCLDWRPVPGSPLIPPELEEWKPDPFSFLYAAMGLLSFLFQGVMSFKKKLPVGEISRETRYWAASQHRTTPNRKLNSQLQKVGPSGTATGFQTGLEPPPSCDMGEACGVLPKLFWET